VYDSVVNPSGCIGFFEGDDGVLLDKRPPDTAAVPPEEDARFVESNSNPFREDEVAPRALAVDGLGGAGAFVTLFRFFPNFFFPDVRALFLSNELISVCLLALSYQQQLLYTAANSVEEFVLQYWLHVDWYE
jgi:hypothetical protein